MNNQGSIVNASSIAGLIGFPKHAAYTACKHGWSCQCHVASYILTCNSCYWTV
jgi:NADP-dependent 3-hydroxy acid dehydrogenase YdfG